jgi:hypothetical protein
MYLKTGCRLSTHLILKYKEQETGDRRQGFGFPTSGKTGQMWGTRPFVAGAGESSTGPFLPSMDDDASGTKQKAQPRRLSLFSFSTL